MARRQFLGVSVDVQATPISIDVRRLIYVGTSTITNELVSELAEGLGALAQRSTGQLKSDLSHTGGRILEQMKGGFSKVGNDHIRRFERGQHKRDRDVLADIKADSGGSYWVLRLGQSARLYGLLSGDVFTALWWDPEHQMIPPNSAAAAQ